MAGEVGAGVELTLWDARRLTMSSSKRVSLDEILRLSPGLTFRFHSGILAQSCLDHVCRVRPRRHLGAEEARDPLRLECVSQLP